MSHENLGDNPVSLEILNGGHFYYVSRAYTNVTGKPCPVASLRAKRHCVPEKNEWSVDVCDVHATQSVCESTACNQAHSPQCFPSP